MTCATARSGTIPKVFFYARPFFGVTLENADGRKVPVRSVGEQHVKDDLGWIPSVKDWLENLQMQPWMGKTAWRPSDDADQLS